MARTSKLSADTIAEMFRRFEEQNPNPRGELTYSNPFTLLVAVVLSAQATDAGVNRATVTLFKRADTAEKMASLDLDYIQGEIKTIGLYRAKAKNVLSLSQQIVRDHGGEVPADRKALEALPGVGRKTANVVLNVAFRQPTIAVDTHVFRVSNRTGLAPGKTPEEVETKLVKIIPQPYQLEAHHWLLLHGRYICKARTPDCWRCLIADLCRFKPKTAEPS